MPHWFSKACVKHKNWFRRGSGLGQRGIAAVEFALIMPTLILVFLGAVEVLTLYREEAKINALAGNVAQMVAVTQETSLSTEFYNTNSAVTLPTITSLQDICQGAAQALQPFPAAGLNIYIASVTLEPSALNSNTAGSFDEWEADSTVTTGTSCTTTAGTALLTGQPAVVSVATKNAGSDTETTTAMLANPCDNIIIVQASLVYPGILGLLPTRPTLVQTAYARWSSASTQTQLLCPTCTEVPTPPLDYCNANNTATN